MSDAPYREHAEATNVCPRCAEMDARRDAIMARLNQAATYLMRFLLCMLMVAHSCTATVALASVMGGAVALFYGVLGVAAMGGFAAGVVSYDRPAAVSWIIAWTRLTAVSWAVFVWSMN